MSSKSELRKIARELETLIQGTRSASDHVEINIDTEILRENLLYNPDPRPGLLQDLEKISMRFAKDVKRFYDLSRIDAGAGHFGWGVQTNTGFGLTVNLDTIVKEGYFPANPKLRKMFLAKIAEADRYVYTQWMKSHKGVLIDTLDTLGIVKVPRNFEQLQDLLESEPSLRGLKEILDDSSKSFMRRRKLKFFVHTRFTSNESGEGGLITMQGTLYKLYRNEIELFDNRIEADTDDQLVRKFKALCDKNLKQMI